MLLRVGTLALALSLLLSCTAAVRYSEQPTHKRYRPEEPTHKTTDLTEVTSPQDDEEGTTQVPHGQNTQLDKSRMNRIVARYLGTRYEYGGTGRLGIDCSGLMYVLYRDYDGTRLPLNTEALYRLDNRVDYNNLTYGDLVFFRLSGRRVSHVGMYLENAHFVHASESRGVTVDDLTDDYYAGSYAGARRIR